LTLFSQEYIKIVGVEGITNYIHLLGSGHVKYYMQEHQNLYKYSQQGWESLNANFKQVFLIILSEEETPESILRRVRNLTFFQS
jgi:hypothetical protein